MRKQIAERVLIWIGFLIFVAAWCFGIYRLDGTNRYEYGAVFSYLAAYDRNPGNPCNIPPDSIPGCPLPPRDALEQAASYFWIDAWAASLPVLLGAAVLSGIPLMFGIVRLVAGEQRLRRFQFEGSYEGNEGSDVSTLPPPPPNIP